MRAQRFGELARPHTRGRTRTGTPRSLPHGYKALSLQQVRDDTLHPLRSAESAINNTRLLLWLVAAVIVGVVMYMSALDRVRDFAVLKAVGATMRTLVVSLAAEAVLTCLIAAALAIGFAQLLLPLFPLPITYTVGAYAALPLIAVVVGVLGSLAGCAGQCASTRPRPLRVPDGRPADPRPDHRILAGDYLVRPIDSLRVEATDGELTARSVAPGGALGRDRPSHPSGVLPTRRLHGGPLTGAARRIGQNVAREGAS
jgi:hypothetical protein